MSSVSLVVPQKRCRRYPNITTRADIQEQQGLFCGNCISTGSNVIIKPSETQAFYCLIYFWPCPFFFISQISFLYVPVARKEAPLTIAASWRWVRSSWRSTAFHWEDGNTRMLHASSLRPSRPKRKITSTSWWLNQDSSLRTCTLCSLDQETPFYCFEEALWTEPYDIVL